jgi:hypothetical protein
MQEDAIKITGQRNNRKVRILLLWRDTYINLATYEFRTDGSLVFSSAFHNITDMPIEEGNATLQEDKFTLSLPDTLKQRNGIHLSLHPRSQVAHLREHEGGPILISRKFQWFPVTQPFNLFYLYTPPMNLCKPSSRRSHLSISVPNKYEGSLLIKADIFPENIKTFQVKDVFAVIPGFSPLYNVLLTFRMVDQIVDPILLFPTDSRLIL